MNKKGIVGDECHTGMVWFVISRLVVILIFFLIIFLIITTFLELTKQVNSNTEIDKSDCMWSVCYNQDIQWCNNWDEYLTAEYCCNGCPCSNVYYDENKTCHFINGGLKK